MERENVAIGEGAIGLDCARLDISAAYRPVQAIDQGIQRSALQILYAPDGSNRALADLTVLGAIALDQLQVAATARCCDLSIHATIISSQNYSLQDIT